jgi:hypothetical protein
MAAVPASATSEAPARMARGFMKDLLWRSVSMSFVLGG